MNSTQSPGGAFVAEFEEVLTKEEKRAVIAAAKNSPPNLGLDDTIGPYRLRDFLGQGGYGTVWKAERDRATVAVKIFRNDAFQGNQRARAALYFFQGAKLMPTAGDDSSEASVSANIVRRIHGPECDPSGRIWFAMDYVPGTSLARALHEETVSWTQLIELVPQLIDAVAAAHKRDLVHRDIRPANVLINDGRTKVYLTDFDLAFLARDRNDRETTAAFQAAQSYHPPEVQQLKGRELAKALRAKESDIYATCMTIFEMFTGSVDRKVACDPQALRALIAERAKLRGEERQTRARVEAALVAIGTRGLADQKERSLRAIAKLRTEWVKSVSQSSLTVWLGIAGAIVILLTVAVALDATVAALSSRAWMIICQAGTGLTALLAPIVAVGGIAKSNVTELIRRTVVSFGALLESRLAASLSALLAALLMDAALLHQTRSIARISEFVVWGAKECEIDATRTAIGPGIEVVVIKNGGDPLLKCPEGIKPLSQPRSVIGIAGSFKLATKVVASPIPDPRTDPADAGAPDAALAIAGIPDCPENTTFFQATDQNAKFDGFCMANLEASASAYQECVKAGHCLPLHSSIKWYLTDGDYHGAFDGTCVANNLAQALKTNLPANCIDWDNAAQHCAYRRGRLPRRDEWVVALDRASARRRAPELLDETANVCGINCLLQASQSRRADLLDAGLEPDSAIEMARKKREPWPNLSPVEQADGFTPVVGLRGNVAEWLSDDGGDGRKVVAGEDWYSPPRRGFVPFIERAHDERHSRVGFRCVWDHIRSAARDR